jgi:uncharacterized protein YcfJ
METTMKLIITTAILALTAGLASADPIKGEVTDHYKTVTEYIEQPTQKCEMVKVPVYETVKKKGDAAGGALAGMIIGGILGKGVSGNDDGAAAVILKSFLYTKVNSTDCNSINKGYGHVAQLDRATDF